MTEITEDDICIMEGNEEYYWSDDSVIVGIYCNNESDGKQVKQQILDGQKALEEWKQRLQNKAHLIEYSHEMLIDKIDNEILKGDHMEHKTK